MKGPPFSVNEKEIQTLFLYTYDKKLLLILDVLDNYPQFRTLGSEKLKEKVYLLNPSNPHHR